MNKEIEIPEGYEARIEGNKIFIELRESKDERIRRKLIDFFSGYNSDKDWWGDITEEDILSYLEKQKKQKTRFSTKQFCLNDFEEELFLLLRGMKYLNVSDEEIAHNVKNQIAPNLLELVQKKQKSTDISSLRDWKFIVDAVLTEHEGIGQYLDKPETERIAKKLQERFNLPQSKPAEWIEEDEELKRAIIDNLFILKQMYKHPDKQIDYNRMIEWLKSLRPSWKPSEEQMGALKNARYMMSQSRDYYDTVQILDSLINDLKGYNL